MRDPSCKLTSTVTLLLALAPAVWLGCSRADDVAWQPVYRLTQELDPPLASDMPTSCSVANDIRPALGCPRTLPILRSSYPFPERDSMRLQARLPALLRAGLVIVEPRLQGKDSQGWVTLPPLLLRGRRPGLSLTMPLANVEPDEKLEVNVDGVVVPPKSQHFRTKAITVGRNAALRVAVAVLPLAGAVGGSPAEFVIRARGASGDEEILRTTVSPADSREGWISHRVDLSDLAGETVRFVLSTDVVAASGNATPENEPFSIPVWGGLEILERLPRHGQRNIVLVSLDTLRGDVVGSAPVGVELTPRLDRVAERGAKFTQAIAPYPSTTASHMSLFTSVYPAVHKVLHAKHVLPVSIPTLGQILSANGYLTSAVTEDGMLAAEVGFDRGFDDYRENRSWSMWDAQGDVEKTIDASVHWLQRHRDTKLFLFVHTYQVHNPYKPPAAFDLFSSVPRPGKNPQIDTAHNRYLGEVRYTDHVLGRLLDTLVRLDLAKDSIVVVTSDHGDEFGEHGSMGHSKGVFDEVLRVPLIVWAPGLVPQGERVDAQVSLVDLAPTILDLVHIPRLTGMQGESLAPLLLGKSDAPRVEIRFAETPPFAMNGVRQFSVRTNRYKWIAREDKEEPDAVYDLIVDPGETKNLTDPALRAKGRELLSIYRDMDARAAQGRAMGEAREVDTSTQDKLRALGYAD